MRALTGASLSSAEVALEAGSGWPGGDASGVAVSPELAGGVFVVLAVVTSDVAVSPGLAGGVSGALVVVASDAAVSP
ncbi:hypothetical protein OV207_27900 [Corallococcus sp. BB11-1]|uniref:hypothetical protein n=1 Tax=Corallococcus sp. BB11-1 TaxID=2996783 RepID=UPI00226F2DEA|nr:hypothetical protein [Corallococcus sp. BB11-1]MCY1035302.1 hypothetical protein [Corallococcus sp. BB11-1]